MPQKCSICNHKKRLQIEESLANGASLRNIVERYGTSIAAVSRHRKNCIPAQMVEHKEHIQIASMDDFIQKLENNLRATEGVLKEAQEGYDDKDADGKTITIRRNPTVALRAVDSHNKTLSMYLDLFKEARDAEDHELKVFRREQEDAMKIVMEEISVYPELAEKIADRLGGL